MVFDKSNNGYISVSELRYSNWIHNNNIYTFYSLFLFLTNIGDKLTDSEFDEFIKDIEVNSEGSVNYEGIFF